MKKKIKNNKRTCPSCKNKIIYSDTRAFQLATKENRICHKCAMLKAGKEGKLSYWKNHSFSDIHRDNIRKNGKNQFTGTPIYDVWLEKYGKKEADRRENIRRQKLSNIRKGKTYSEIYGVEAAKIKRINMINKINKNKNSGNQISPWYNSNACKIIEEYGKTNGYNFQHAENGGEFHIKNLGYFVDGYDKDKNIVIEYYESHHYKNGKLKEKEILREKEIIQFLNCRFIRIHAQNENQLNIEVI